MAAAPAAAAAEVMALEPRALKLRAWTSPELSARVLIAFASNLAERSTVGVEPHRGTLTVIGDGGGRGHGGGGVGALPQQTFRHQAISL